MAEGTFEYECMRAELLGLDKPDYETFLANQKEKAAVQEEELENELIKDAEDLNESYGRVSAGLHDINSILSITQKKLNTFKSACGSLTNLLKIKVGSSGSTDSLNQNPNGEDPSTSGDTAANSSAATNGHGDHPGAEDGGPVSGRAAGAATDLGKALDQNMGRLDALIIQAETAEYSMKHQTKQMRSFLK